MKWNITADRPVYLQLIEQLELAIVAGEYRAGARLPGVREMAAGAAVNPNTMQRALQEMIRNKLTSIQRIEVSNDRIGNQDILSMVMQSDMDKIHMTLEETNREDFDRAVSAIVDARHIYILGVRSAAALASFLGFYFNLIFDNVTVVHATSTSEVFEQLLRIGPNDVIVGVSFPRYSRRTVKAMQFAHDRGAATIALTDSETSPLAPISTLTLLAKSDMASFVDSLVAPLSIINALIVAVGRKKAAEVTETFQRLEQIWDEYKVYEKVEYDSNTDSMQG